MKRRLLLSLAAMGSFVLMIGFQNCAQPGQLALQEIDGQMNGAMMMIPMGQIDEVPVAGVPPTEDSDLRPEVLAPNPQPLSPPIGDDSSTEKRVIAQPAPVAQQLTAPPVAEQLPKPPASEAPTQIAHEAPKAQNCDSKKEESKELAKHEEDDEMESEDSDYQPMEEVTCSKERSNIADIKLSIDSISIPNSKKTQVTILENEPFISTHSRRIILTADADVEVSHFKILLNDDNTVLFKDRTYAELKTPSAQQSGIKVQLDHSLKMAKNKSYQLFLQFELEDQLVVAGKHCLFKPVIHVGNLQAAN
jgi:hypothetical protein